MNTQDANNKQVKVALPARHMPGIAVTTGVRGGTTVEERCGGSNCQKVQGGNFSLECTQCLAPFMVDDGGEVRPEPGEKAFECAGI